MSNLFSALGWFLMLTCLVLSVYFGFQAIAADGLYSFLYSVIAVAGACLSFIVAATTDHYNSIE